MASGNPFSPSTHAMKMSSTPRLRSSVTTCNQSLAPSWSELHNPSILRTLQVHPDGNIDGPVLHVPGIAHPHVKRVHIDNGVPRLQRCCQACTSSCTALVTSEISAGLTSTW